MGKSCLLLRFADDTYTESYITTIGVDFVSSRHVTLNYVNLRLIKYFVSRYNNRKSELLR